ncbi:nucleotidyl transferase AbiEii/AbiGii toxin family protein [Stutzerimonas nitrititolerans]|nr:nucleotidyl transferase AbiEii/AbiGii toxin family protein [Stutzerimonas nitrititolerans]
MVFKGGKSLSQACQAVERCSEDIDVTVHYRRLGE